MADTTIAVGEAMRLMLCEICGREIKYGEKIKIESAVVIVCKNCAAALSKGTRIGKVTEKSKTETKPKIRRELPEEDIIEDYASVIREAREKEGLSQEGLAKELKEKLSVITRIEAGKMIPTMELAKKMEKLLKIKLIEKTSGDAKITVSKTDETLTLGDIVKIKKRKK